MDLYCNQISKMRTQLQEEEKRNEKVRNKINQGETKRMREKEREKKQRRRGIDLITEHPLQPLKVIFVFLR